MRKPLKLKAAYEELLGMVVSDLESGQIPWKMPWFAKIPTNFHTKQPYHGINVLALNSVARKREYSSHYWITERQAIRRGGNIRKNEIDNPAFIIMAKWESISSRDETGEEQIDWWLMMREYRVYNLEQTSGLRYTKEQATIPLFNRDERAEEIVFGYKDRPTIKYDPERAYYRPYHDDVHIPKIDQFASQEEYYSTLFHELVHSTGHTKRLSRSSFHETIHFGDTSYAKEELIAELGAAFLCAQLGFFSQTRKNTAAYLQSWLAALLDDRTLLLQAASHAQRACDCILGNRLTIQEAQIEKPPVSDTILAKASPKSIWA